MLGRPASIRDSPVSMSPVLGSQECAARLRLFKNLSSEVKLMSSRLHGKHFTTWSISPAPSIVQPTQHLLLILSKVWISKLPFHLFILIKVCVCAKAHCMEVRGRLAQVSSLFPPMDLGIDLRILGLAAGAFAESSCWPQSLPFMSHKWVVKWMRSQAKPCNPLETSFNIHTGQIPSGHQHFSWLW